MAVTLSPELRKCIIEIQREELTGHIIYGRLAESIRDEGNKAVLKQFAEDERGHYEVWRGYTKVDVRPKSLQVWGFPLIARLFGLTFALKFLERGEDKAQKAYERISEYVPEASEIIKKEAEHEEKLFEMINEERLKYVGSMVLGLNDALVELTGALAGFTFALQTSRLVAMTGLITGIAASFSMGTSEYLSTKSEGGDKSPRKASMYTTMAYLMTVSALITPYMILESVYLSLVFSLVTAVLIIFIFTFYISVAKSLPFKRRFLETASISLCVAGLTFVIGLLVRLLFGIEV